ncbi:MAG: methyl-accepting chemotaxis protein [Candidatus Sulfotelmatobacter sp.]
MQLTIKTQLFGLTISGLVFVAAVSATGYWGITSVHKTTVEVAATGSAIRNHIEAGVYNDLTRTDTSAVFTAKGDEQQNKAEEFAQHSKLLEDRIAKARDFAVDPASRKSLDDEKQMSSEYVKAGDALVGAIIHNPSAAPGLLGAYLQLYKDLQGKIEDTSDQLAKSAKDAEFSAAKKAAGATRTMFVMCGMSLLLLLVVASRVTLSITRGLDSFSTQFRKMADANDLTSRVDQDRKDEIGDLGKCLNLFVEKVHDILTQVAHAVQEVSGASSDLSTTSQQITANSEETSAQAKVVSNATQQVSQNLQTVATGAEEMGASIKEIAKNATEAARIATSAVRVAETTTATVSKLGESSNEIGQVIKVITSIAQQTNLLALNATIEAARAGEAGKATEDISRKIEAIQSDTKAAVEAIASISEVINQVNGISSTIATAVEEQNATTNEMSRNVSEAAHGSGEITSNIAGVAQAAESTSRGAGDTQKAAQQLVETSAELRRLVEQFKIKADSGSQAAGTRSMAAHA